MCLCSPFFSPLCVCVCRVSCHHELKMYLRCAHTHECVAPALRRRQCVRRKKKGKKQAALQQLGARAMKQQALGCLYCLSVVYGPVFAFNYYTKLNSNRHLEATGSHVHVRPPARPPARPLAFHARSIYFTHTDTPRRSLPSTAEVRTKKVTRLLVLSAATVVVCFAVPSACFSVGEFSPAEQASGRFDTVAALS